MTKPRVPATLGAVLLLALSTFYLNSLVAVPAGRPAAQLVSDFSSSRYFDHVKYLASDDMKGRGNGTPELNKAADYIASQFRLWGLRPMGDNNTYFQQFELTTGATVGADNELQINGTSLTINEDFVPITFSNTARFDGPL